MKAKFLELSKYRKTVKENDIKNGNGKKHTKKVTEDFIEDARAIHGDKYDYSKVEYNGSEEKVCIVCPAHGEFWQRPHTHLKGHGCPECGKLVPRKVPTERHIRHKQSDKFVPNKEYQKLKIKTTDEFVEYCKNLYNGKYNYDQTVYEKMEKDVFVICPIHGKFKQRAYRHLEGSGCPKCSKEKGHQKNKLTIEEFIKAANAVHDNKYDYSEVEYINNKTKVKIICPIHGEFYQQPNEHLRGRGCQKCAYEKIAQHWRKTKEDFIEKANKIFKGKYGYENVDYVDRATKVLITCPKHGDFLCTPANHLRGSGCPTCKNESYVYEERLYNLLKTVFEEDDIIRQYRPSFLTNHKSIDFFVKSCNLAIEHQGRQHYHKNSLDKYDEEKLQKRKENDLRKYQECLENGINVLYFSYELHYQPKGTFHKLFFTEEELLKEINNFKKN